jgi:hypothetical protein
VLAAYYSLKEFVSFYAIKIPRLHATMLKSVYLIRMDKDLPGLVSLAILSPHAQGDTLF